MRAQTNLGRVGKRFEPRLSEEDVAAIRADTRSQNTIARAYGVSQTYISDLKRGKYRRGPGAG